MTKRTTQESAKTSTKVSKRTSGTNDAANRRWLDRHERQRGEAPPLGIVLCAGKKRETVEYLDLDTRGIHVAEYLTDLPPREVL